MTGSDLIEEILRRRLPPDLIEEILLRLPPDDPGCLFRASCVCKPWRSLLTSSGFASRYRKFHRTPPLLGFFEIHHSYGCWFAPSASTSPLPPIHPDHRELFVLDSRHGLVLMRTPGFTENKPPASFIVWDPVARRQWEFPPPKFGIDFVYDNAMVLCPANALDHLGCRGRPFTVAYVSSIGNAYASVFSSETRAWSSVATISNVFVELLRCRTKALVGNVLYFACCKNRILCYDLFSRKLSVIKAPRCAGEYYVLMKIDQGVLGCAMMDESDLCLYSMDTGLDGAVAWTLRTVIELEDRLIPSHSLDVFDFVDGPGVFCLRDRARSRIFTVELKSGRVKKIFINRFSVLSAYNLMPYMSFYTPDQAGPRTLPSTMASSSENVERDREKDYGSLLPHSSEQVGDGQGNGEEGHGWEEVSAKKESDEEEERQREKAAQELFDKGDNEDVDFVCRVDCFRRALKIRVALHGKLSPKCFSTYFQYGYALRLKSLSGMASTTMRNDNRYSEDLDLVWRMLHVGRSILAKSPGNTMEEMALFTMLANVSIQEDVDYSLIACFKALAILEHLVEPDHRHIFDLNLQICFAFELESKIIDAKAISLYKSHIESLKRANENFLADKGDDASATEVGSRSLAEHIELVTKMLLCALKMKLEDLEEAISAPVSEAIAQQDVGNDVSSQYSEPGSDTPTGSTRTDLEAAGRGIKRANVKQISSEPSPKKFAEGSSSSAEVYSNNSSDSGSEGSVSE